MKHATSKSLKAWSISGYGGGCDIIVMLLNLNDEERADCRETSEETDEEPTDRSIADLVDLFDPPVDAVKGPAVGDVIHQNDALEKRQAESGSFWETLQEVVEIYRLP